MKISFLLYCARSGSTFFASQVAKWAENVVVLPEFRLPQILLGMTEAQCMALSPNGLQRLFSQDIQFDNLGFCLGQQQLLAQELSGRGRRAVFCGVLEAYRRTHGTTGSHFLVKNGRLIYQMTELLDVFPDANLIEVLRDPRGVVNSMSTTKTVYSYGGAMAGGDPLRALDEWKQYRLASLRLRDQRSSQAVKVLFEKLVSDDAYATGLIERHFGVRQSESAGLNLSALESNLHPRANASADSNRSDSWKFELAEHTGMAIEALLGDSLTSAGYAPYFSVNKTEQEIQKAVANLRLLSRKRRAVHYFKTTMHWLALLPKRPAKVFYRIRQAWRTRIDRC